MGSPRARDSVAWWDLWASTARRDCRSCSFWCKVPEGSYSSGCLLVWWYSWRCNRIGTMLSASLSAPFDSRSCERAWTRSVTPSSFYSTRNFQATMDKGQKGQGQRGLAACNEKARSLRCRAPMIACNKNWRKSLRESKHSGKRKSRHLMEGSIESSQFLHPGLVVAGQVKSDQ